MEQKNYIIIAAIVLVLLVGGFFVFQSSTSEDAASDANLATQDREQEVQPQPNVEENTNTLMEPPENAITYEIAQGSNASYTVQKRFIGKEAEEVTGVTQSVDGTGWIVPETGEFYLMANVDVSSLTTDSSQRDEDIQPFFTEKTVTFVVTDDGTSEPLIAGDNFTKTVVGQLTINNITNPVTFEVEGTLGADTFVATGATTILMSDFGIEPPSALNIYTVDDETVLSFEVSGNAQAPIAEQPSDDQEATN